MVGDTQVKPRGTVSHHSTILGWEHLVAPTIAFARQALSGGASSTQVGSLPRLPGPGYATYEVAPSWMRVVRWGLEDKQVSAESIGRHLKSLEG